MTSTKSYALSEALMFNKVSVALVGLGGSGGEMLESLVRIDLVLKELGHSGLEIHLFDDDRVSQSNIGRTRFSVVDVGQYKVDVLASRFNLFYGLTIKAHAKRFDPSEMFNFNLIVSCTDSASFRVSMGEFIEDNTDDLYRQDADELLWLDLGNESYTGQYVLGHLWHGNAPFKIPNVYDLYGKELREAEKVEDNSSSCSLKQAIEIQSLFINKTLVTHASALLYQLFKDGVILTHGGFVDLKSHTVKPLRMDTKIWQFLVN